MIHVDDIEADLSETCNLRCTHCSHMSPLFTNTDIGYTIEKFTADISNLSKLMKINVFRIVGGEPLLNKQLKAYTSFVKDQNIASKISLFTNGILLPKVNLSFLNDIDELRVSLYEYKNSNINEIVGVLRGIKLSYPHLHIAANKVIFFTKANLIEKNKDPKLVRDIYDRCFHARHGKSIFNGKLYRCFVDRKRIKFLENYKHLVRDDYEDLKENTDSVLIDEKLSETKLQIFLNNDNPLKSCEWCLGCSGKYFEHSQLPESTKINDYATLQDLDFDQGASYISNCLYNWYNDRFEFLAEEPSFDICKLSEHGIHHTEPVNLL